MYNEIKLFLPHTGPRQPIYSSDSDDDSFDEEKDRKKEKKLNKAKKLEDSDEVGSLSIVIVLGRGLVL